MLVAVWLNFKLGSVERENAARVRITVYLHRQHGNTYKLPIRDSQVRKLRLECFP